MTSHAQDDSACIQFFFTLLEEVAAIAAQLLTQTGVSDS